MGICFSKKPTKNGSSRNIFSKDADKKMEVVGVFLVHKGGGGRSDHKWNIHLLLSISSLLVDDDESFLADCLYLHSQRNS